MPALPHPRLPRAFLRSLSAGASSVRAVSLASHSVVSLASPCAILRGLGFRLSDRSVCRVRVSGQCMEDARRRRRAIRRALRPPRAPKSMQPCRHTRRTYCVRCVLCVQTVRREQIRSCARFTVHESLRVKLHDPPTGRAARARRTAPQSSGRDAERPAAPRVAPPRSVAARPLDGLPVQIRAPPLIEREIWPARAYSRAYLHRVDDRLMEVHVPRPRPPRRVRAHADHSETTASCVTE